MDPYLIYADMGSKKVDHLIVLRREKTIKPLSN